MASALPNILVHSKLAIDSVTWTAIQPPIDCNSLYVLIDGGQDVKIRTDSADANTEKTMVAGTEWQPIGGAKDAYSGLKPRFQKSVTVAFAQAVSGTGPLRIGAEL